MIQKICENYNWRIQEKGIPTKGAKFLIGITKTINKGKKNIHNKQAGNYVGLKKYLRHVGHLDDT